MDWRGLVKNKRSQITDSIPDLNSTEASFNKMGEEKNPFEYQSPSEASVEKISVIREACKALHKQLLELSPSRERSVAITKLEEVSMWANKHIVFNEQ